MFGTGRTRRANGGVARDPIPPPLLADDAHPLANAMQWLFAKVEANSETLADIKAQLASQRSEIKVLWVVVALLAANLGVDIAPSITP